VLIEQANGVVRTKLWCWLADHGGQGWSDALPNITSAMNRQSHSLLGSKMPYETLFNQQPQWKDRVVVGSDMQVDRVEDESTGKSTNKSADGAEEIPLAVETLMRTIAY